jgi:DNA-binding NarL/FixJ family response regulator
MRIVLANGGFKFMPARVLIVEDDAEFRLRFETIVSEANDLVLAGSVGFVADALTAIEGCAFDVLLVDLGLPDGTGVDVIRAAHQRCPAARIMVVSVFGDEENVVQSIVAGASGYILKDSLSSEFILTIRELLAGGSPISPMVARLVLNQARSSFADHLSSNEDLADATFTEREIEILSRVAKGFSFSEIANLLDISVNTVKTHVNHIYGKLSVHSRSEAVYEAGKIGLLKDM